MGWMSGWMSPAALALGAALTALGCASAGGAFVPASLVGSSWVAESVDGHGTVGRPPITLMFESAERAVGSTGCNRYFAAIRMSGDSSTPPYVPRLVFGQSGSTRMACAPEVMDQEQKYLAVLASVQSYRLNGTALVLLDAAGLARVRLVRGAIGRPTP